MLVRVARLGPVGHRQTEVGRGQNLEDDVRLALHGELQLTAGIGRVDQIQGGRFDQAHIVHIPISSGQLECLGVQSN